MNRDPLLLALSFLVGSALTAWGKLSPEQVGQLAPPATHPVEFATHIKPIFESSCIKCHGRGKSKGGFALDTRETLLRGGEAGPAVIAGNSAGSYLIELVSGLDPDNVMPLKGSKLTREQVGVLRAWIDQGMPWDAGVSFGRLPPIHLDPPTARIPVGPSAPRTVNGIDVLLKPYLEKHQVAAAELVSDRVFARRVYLDVIGLLPTPEELEAFARDDRADKRPQLVKRLLSDRLGYAQHWLSYWNDLLRNDYKGTGYIDDGRKQITDWLYSALAQNLPFDQFVAQLIDPVPGSEGFVKGIVWRGVVNASQTPEMQAAQNISQVFMGVNLKCASCHDSFINDWTLADAYGLASVYAENELEMVQCDKPTGQIAAVKFLYPELGSIDAATPKSERMRRLADIITSEKNGRLSRTMVNRLWARFMGRGLVEPLDDMEQPSWHPELLDWLAADLAAHQYDLKKTIERILTSEAYQWKSVPATEAVAKEYTFRGPLVRRLSAEQFEDALSRVTGVWHAMPTNPQADFSAGGAEAPLSEVENPARARWIWSSSGAEGRTASGTVYFRKRVDLPREPTHAAAVITCDNSFKLFVNGREAASGGDHNKPVLIDLRPHLKQGENVLAIRAVNHSAASREGEVDQGNPAGLFCYARIRHESGEGDAPVLRIWDVASCETWRWSTHKVDGWEELEFAATDWAPAVELGPVGMAPWNLEKKLAQSLSAAALAGRVRASLVAADSLMTALGRPNREQVITSRASSATTLQALEMTNGKTLAERLKEGSEKLLETAPSSSHDLVVELFERALARVPRRDELRLGQELVGSPVRREGVEDLLWAVAMLPEFQLIY